MVVWRSLFLIFIVFTVTFFVSNATKLVVDTSLNDLSPNLNLDENTQDAMDELAKDISLNILFVVGSNDKQKTEELAQQIGSDLTELESLTVLSSASIPLAEIIDSLSKYRFQLLTEKQRNTLESKSNTDLASEAQSKLFRLTNTPMLSFENDPLGLHSEYFADLLKKISNDLNETRTNVSNTDSKNKKYYQVIQTKLKKGGLGIDAQNKLLSDINVISNSIKGDASAKQNQVEILRSGVFFFAVDAAAKSKKDISLISSISMLGVFLVLLYTFRSVVPLILPFLSIAFGVAFAVAVSHSIYGKIHILTIVFGASLIGIVIDYSIHYFFHISKENKTNTSSHKNLHSALLLSLATSLLGYLALYFSQLDALKKVAVFSCCGLTMAWLSVVCLGQYSNTKIASSQQTIGKILDRIRSLSSFLKPSLLRIIIIGLILGLLFSVLKLKSNDDPRFFFTADEKILANEVEVSKIASDYEPGRFVLIRGESEEALFENTLEFFDQVETHSKQQKLSENTLTTKNFKSITQWLPAPKQQRENYISQAKVYADTGAVNNLYELLGVDKKGTEKIKTEYTNSADLILKPDSLNELFNDILPPLWSGDKNSYRNFILIAKGTDFESLEKLSKTLPSAQYINSVEKAKQSLAEQRVSASKLLVLAYVLIILLIFFRYRNLSALKIVLVPLCATAALIIIFTVLGISFNLFHIMALFLVLGLGMDYGIFAYELSDGSVTQQAILISAITSLLSFGLLGLSSIPVAQSFGTILFLGNSFNLIASLIYSNSLTSNQAK